MESIVTRAIECVQKAKVAYCKFITPNDTGQTGGHQSGFHLHKDSWPLLFESKGEKGSNKDKFVKIRWQNAFETDSRFIYYGVGTRNEYRLTRFGRDFPFLNDDAVGDLLVLCQLNHDYYEAFVLQTDEETEDFLSAFGLSPTETNRIIPKETRTSPEEKLLQCFSPFIQFHGNTFPDTESMAQRARHCVMTAYGVLPEQVRNDSDSQILKWIEAEYQLFRIIENELYGKRIAVPFTSVQELVDLANTIINRRKSRAGKSLEHHLSEIFKVSGITFSTQCTTEANKKPDFIFPSIDAYHDARFDSSKLTFLASKTTCKDRWRQILNEADRIETKYLFTLQQGISSNQLGEMYDSGVRLVVPATYRNSFPAEFRAQILTLNEFLSRIENLEKTRRQ